MKPALVAQQFHPLIAAGTKAPVILPAADNLLDLIFRQIFFQISPGPISGAVHNPLMFKRQFKQKRNPLIRPSSDSHRSH